MAKNAGATARKSRAKIGDNSKDKAEVRPYFDEIHDLLDAMEEYSASKRQAIGKVYDKLSDKIGVPKEAIKFAFKAERRERKDDAKVAKMDQGVRDGLAQLARELGGSLGDFLKDKASIAGTAESEGE